jgi:hypothetical protein
LERDPEGGHHGVAGEFLHCPAVRGDAVGDLVEVAPDTAPRDLGVDVRDQVRGAHEIDEEDRRQLALDHPAIVVRRPG